MLVALVSVAMVGVAVAAGPMFTRYVIDTALPQRRLGLAVCAVGLFVALMFVRMGVWYLATVNILWVRERFLFALREQSFHQLQRLSLKFHNEHAPGFIFEQVFGQPMIAVTVFLQSFFQQLAVWLTGLAFSLVFCLRMSPVMTLVILIGASAYVVVARLFASEIYKLSRERSQTHATVVAFIMDKLRGVKTIQAFSLEDRVGADFVQQVWEMHARNNVMERHSLRLGFVSEGLGYLLQAVILIVGANAVLQTRLTIGSLVAFLAYQGTFIGIIQTLVSVYGQFVSARAGLDEILTIWDTRTTVPEKPGATMPPRVTGNLEFRQLTFGYREGVPVLRDLNLIVPAGQTVALVGRSGCGKTTLTNLLMRLYDPDAGAVLLDGQDIRELPLRAYRRLFGVVLQDPYLFETSVSENLRCARPDATEDEIREALRRAQALDFVTAMPGGIHASVGEGGGRLSGGQRQRLAIARCLMLRPRFVILDEPTAALDNESEHLIQQALRELFAGRTVLIVAHRLSTIRRADRILVMDQGRVVEDGTFTELMAQRGLFHHLHTIDEPGTTSKNDAVPAA